MNARSLLFLLAANFLGGSSYVATGYALRGFPSMPLVFWRTFLGGAVLFPLALRAARNGELGREDWLRMAAVGVFGLAAPLVIGTIGQAHSSATNASLLIGVEPVTILILSSIFLGERLTRAKIACIFSSMAGAAIIVLQGIPFYNARITPHFRGDVLLFIHGFGWALYSVIGKPVLRKVDPLVYTAITTAFAVVPIALASFSQLWQVSAPGAAALGAIAYLGFGVTILGTWSWNKALEAVPASTLAHFVFLQPVIGVLLGTFLQKERLSAWSVLGGGLILIGVYGASRQARP